MVDKWLEDNHASDDPTKIFVFYIDGGLTSVITAPAAALEPCVFADLADIRVQCTSFWLVHFQIIQVGDVAVNKRLKKLIKDLYDEYRRLLLVGWLDPHGAAIAVPR